MSETTISFYRKYRPQTVAELDLTQVREFFERILKSGKVAHAYLFTGPRGTGKTSAARILGKIVNCKKGWGEPCNKCDSCKAITNGSLVDVLEIDAASNRGIDDIRDLREKIGLTPVSSKYKVYIIDEVHMLTMEAFNALLKTLEEPPAHALFVLATTEAHKVPETIVSRCVRLNFPQASEAEVSRSLNKAVQGEKLKVDKEAVTEIAKAADGSFREAMKTLEQIALSGKEITVEAALKEVGRSQQVSAEKLLQALVARDSKAAIAALETLGKRGANFQIVIKQVLEELRMELLAGAGVEGYEAKLGQVGKDELLKLIEMVQEAGRQMRETMIPELPLEILTVEWCGVKSQPQVGQPMAEKLVAEESIARSVPVKTVVMKKGKVSFEEVLGKWKEVLQAVRPANHSLEGLLRSTKPMGVDGETLQVEVFYKFHLDQLKQEKFLKLVEEAVAQVMATPLRLEYVLGQRQAQPAPIENISADVDDEDVVRAAEEIFGA